MIGVDRYRHIGRTYVYISGAPVTHSSPKGEAAVSDSTNSVGPPKATSSPISAGWSRRSISRFLLLSDHGGPTSACRTAR